jgi:ATP-dependent helicase HrpB
VALDVRRRASDPAHRAASEDASIVRVASLIEREWLVPTRRETVHRYDEGSRSVRAAIVEWYDALMLTETPVRPDPDAAAAVLADVWLRSPRSDEDGRLLRRLAFAGVAVDVNALLIAAAHGATSLDAIELSRALNRDVRSTLERDAPDTLVLPSGRSVRVEYAADGTPGASAKLQELFGLADTPRLGPVKTPVVLTLLAPNGRPVQVTRDLRSFWSRTYPDVRKELRGRYPRHPWPDDPWTATPTARPLRRPDARKR